MNSGNKYLYDWVGYYYGVVSDYRTVGMAPSQTSFPQQMLIDCGANKVIYTTNTLRAGIDEFTVWSERNGVNQSKVWP